MLKTNPTDPDIVRISIYGYRLLIFFFPSAFRQEYREHIVQVFRDCSLEAHRSSGTRGLLGLWAYTLFDWIKVIIEEQFRREAEMTRPKLIRLSGWSLMLGPLSLFIGLGDPAQYRSLLLSVFGPAEALSNVSTIHLLSETIPLLLIFSGSAMILFGFLGLSVRYQDRTSKLGRLILVLATLCSSVSAVGSIFSLSGAYWWWFVFIFGLLGVFVFLTVYGFIVVREKPMSRWNFLPLFTGGWFLGASVLGLALGWDENPYFMILPMLFALLGLSLMGYILQSDAREHSFHGLNNLEER